MHLNRSNQSFVQLATVTFSSVDYVVFIIFLGLSTAVGIFFYFRSKNTTEDYFIGNRQLGAIPMGISTGVSFMSTASLMGFPAEMFVNGYSYSIGILSGSLGLVFLSCLVANIVQPMRITSLSDYFMKRYNSKLLCNIAKFLVIMCMMHYMGVCMLGSVVAFNTLTGGQVSIIAALVIGGTVGICYTSLGGLKAVVWSDVLQSSFMLIGVIILVIKSITEVSGGMVTIIEENIRYERIHDPNWSFDPRVRHSMWALLFGNFVNWMTYVTQPAYVQRLGALRTLKDCYIASVIAGFIFVVLCTLSSWVGINIFGYYASIGCDIYQRGWAEKNDIIIYFVRDRLNHPGFQGLLLATLFAGSLSSLSSALNASSAILWDEIIKPELRFRVTEMRALLCSKVIVVMIGFLGMAWCYSLYSFGGMILQVSQSLDASVYGAYCGLFLISVSIAWINKKGAISGVMVSFLVTGFLGIGTLFYSRSGAQPMETTFQNCPQNISRNSSSLSEDFEEKGFLEELFSISYLYFSFICLSVNFCVALTVSLCTGRNKIKDPKELLPCCRRLRVCVGKSQEEEEEEATAEEQSDEKLETVSLTVKPV